ncbi:Neuropathy target esterase, partial [Perkinsus olseni]
QALLNLAAWTASRQSSILSPLPSRNGRLKQPHLGEVDLGVGRAKITSTRLPDSLTAANRTPTTICVMGLSTDVPLHTACMSIVDALRIVGISATHVDRSYMQSGEDRCFVDTRDDAISSGDAVGRQALVDLLGRRYAQRAVALGELEERV